MKKLGETKSTTISAARSSSKSLKTTIPSEVVSLLKLSRGDKVAWSKIIDEEGFFGEKGAILAIVGKVNEG
jgi:hypothetical protein